MFSGTFFGLAVIGWIGFVVGASSDQNPSPDLSGSTSKKYPLTDFHNHDGSRDSNGFGNEWVVHLVKMIFDQLILGSGKAQWLAFALPFPAARVQFLHSRNVFKDDFQRKNLSIIDSTAACSNGQQRLDNVD